MAVGADNLANTVADAGTSDMRGRLGSTSRLGKSKRGFFLTLIALLVVALFFLYIQIGQVKQEQPAQIANSALSTAVSSFVSSMQKFYLPNILAVSLHAAIVDMNSYIQTPAGRSQPVPLVNQSAIFYQLITNGTMYPYSSTIYSNDTLNSLLPTFVALAASQLNMPLTLNYTAYQFTVTQNTPWTVTAQVIFLYTVNFSDIVLVNKTLQVTATVPITGMAEPMFIINNGSTSGAPNISQSSTTTWNISALKQFVLQQQFAADTLAPSYLNRLANVTAASAQGIEFFIQPGPFGYNASAVNYTYVDYLFWSRPWNCTPTGQNLFTIQGISDTSPLQNFRLDDNHLGKYINSSERIQNTTLVCS